MLQCSLVISSANWPAVPPPDNTQEWLNLYGGEGGEWKVLRKELLLCYSDHHKSHMHCHRTELEPPQWETSDYPQKSVAWPEWWIRKNLKGNHPPCQVQARHNIWLEGLTKHQSSHFRYRASVIIIGHGISQIQIWPTIGVPNLPCGQITKRFPFKIVYIFLDSTPEQCYMNVLTVQL
jgi:hypothetical protein